MILDQLEYVRLFPKMFEGEENTVMESPFTLEEIKYILRKFSKDKSLRPDGWTVELFLHFFDLMGNDLLEVVEESQLSKTGCGGLNTTFISLISKCDIPGIFDEYMPIALCNLVYKVITKMIAN